MNYKDYLKTEHWLNFRKSILTNRKCCQRCGVKYSLNIHHKNYKNKGKEKNEDVVVLCKYCHNKKHKSVSWKKKIKTGENMDLQPLKIKDSLYKRSSVYRKCNRCWEEHPVFYRYFKNGRKVLVMACPESKPRITCIKYEDGLDIPEYNIENKKSNY